jgi:hypothetical protein
MFLKLRAMKNLSLVMLLCLSIAGYGQKLKLIEGDVSALKGQNAVAIEFKYDNMAVGKTTETEYVAKKKGDYNKKEAGKGDKWEAEWTGNREDKYEPSFKERFSKFSDIATPSQGTDYTLIFKTVKTEPGYNIGIRSEPAYIDAEVWLVDSKDKEKALAKITIMKSPGSAIFGNEFDTAARLTDAYAMAGMELGAFIKGKLK